MKDLCRCMCAFMSVSGSGSGSGSGSVLGLYLLSLVTAGALGHLAQRGTPATRLSRPVSTVLKTFKSPKKQRGTPNPIISTLQSLIHEKLVSNPIVRNKEEPQSL